MEALELEGAEFGDGGLEVHGDELAGVAVGSGQGGFDGRDFLELVVVDGVVEHVARFVLATEGGREKAEPGGFANDEAEFLRRDFGFGAFFHPERGDTERAHGRFEAGNSGNGGFDSDVVGARGAAADANAVALADPSVVSRAAGDGEVEVSAGEFFDGIGTFFFEPGVQELRGRVCGAGLL